MRNIPYLSNEIEKEFIEYFQGLSHQNLASFPIVTNDPSLLFVSAGMVPFKDYFSMNSTPSYNRVVTSQNCMRVGGKHNDLEDVGRTPRHNTFFKMLGNFSFFDYGASEAIEYAYKFLTNNLNLDADRIYITAHTQDTNSHMYIKKITGKDAILLDDNIWSAGQYGPFGQCVEFFFDIKGANYSDGNTLDNKLDHNFDINDEERFLEIWNLVFMSACNLKNGEVVQMPSMCIDTGMGLERITSILQRVYNNFETDIFRPIIDIIQSHNIHDHYMRCVIADHTRCIWHALSEKNAPSNEGAGYVIRKIIRKTIMHLKGSNITLENLLRKIYKENIFSCTDEDYIYHALNHEQMLFDEIFENNLPQIKKLIKSDNSISGEGIFSLYDTYGIPIELLKNFADSHKINLDIDSFNKILEERRAHSRQHVKKSDQMWHENIFYDIAPTVYLYDKYECNASVLGITYCQDGDYILAFDRTVLYGESGGQEADCGSIMIKGARLNVCDVKIKNGIYYHLCKSEKDIEISKQNIVLIHVDKQHRLQTCAHHTTAHIINALLRKHIGNYVVQKGSMLNNMKMRFDFLCHDHLDDAKIAKIELQANQIIRQDLPVKIVHMKFKKAIALGALRLENETYGEKVRTVEFKSDIIHSFELCCGTHVERTSEIKMIKIISVKSIANGIKRIECIASDRAIDIGIESFSQIENIAHALKSSTSDIISNINKLKNEHLEYKKYINTLTSALIANTAFIKDDIVYIIIDQEILDIDILIQISRKLYKKSDIFIACPGQHKTVFAASSPVNKNVDKIIEFFKYDQLNGSQSFCKGTTSVNIDKIKSKCTNKI